MKKSSFLLFLSLTLSPTNFAAERLYSGPWYYPATAVFSVVMSTVGCATALSTIFSKCPFENRYSFSPAAITGAMGLDIILRAFHLKCWSDCFVLGLGTAIAYSVIKFSPNEETNFLSAILLSYSSGTLLEFYLICFRVGGIPAKYKKQFEIIGNAVLYGVGFSYIAWKCYRAFL